MATTLGAAFDQIRADPALAKKFTQDPGAVMKSLGVDTSHLKITKTQNPNPAAAAAAANFCVSVGCVVCGSVG